MTGKKLIFWWLAIALAISLPITFEWMLKNFGGYVTARMYYSNFRTLLSFVSIFAIILVVWLMRLPSSYRELRIAVAVSITIVYLLVAIAPVSTCEEYIELGKLGKNSGEHTSAKNMCDEPA